MSDEYVYMYMYIDSCLCCLCISQAINEITFNLHPRGCESLFYLFTSKHLDQITFTLTVHSLVLKWFTFGLLGNYMREGWKTI